MQKKRWTGLALVVGIFCMGEAQSAHAATLTVTNTNDSGTGSLRATIANASAGDVIAFSTIFNTPKTIALSGEIVIDTDLTINGPSPRLLTISRNTNSFYGRHFTIAPTRTVTIARVRCFDGAMTGLTGDPNPARGGSIVNNGTLTLTECAFSANILFGNQSLPNGNGRPGQGGALYNTNGATLTVERCLFAGNQANGGSGDNGIQSGGAGQGGAIFNDGQAYVYNTTFTNNEAQSAFQGAAQGGAIFNRNDLVLRSDTIIGNRATGGNPDSPVRGGGLYSELGANMLVFTQVKSTVLDSNQVASSQGGNDLSGPDLFGPSNVSYSLVGDTQGATLNGSNNKTNVSAQLGTVRNNGGFTDTALPADSSPVIDAGNDTFSTSDQRGLRRVVDQPGASNVGNGSDIGAVELSDPVSSLIVTTTGDAVDDFDNVVSLREAINFANAHLGSDIISFNISSAPNSNGAWVIQPATVLPSITDAGTSIDGSSQRVFTGTDNNPLGPEIVLDGALVTTNNNQGLRLLAANCTVRDLNVRNFSLYQISNLGNGTGDNAAMFGCYIGTDETGSALSSRGGRGVRFGGDSARIGGNDALMGNLFAGFPEIAVYVTGTNALVQNNTVGLNRAQNALLVMPASSVATQTGIVCTGSGHLIGGEGFNQRNVVAGTDVGIFLLSSQNSSLQKNLIGTNANDATGLGCATGILAEDALQCNIGSSGAGNRIANCGTGIALVSSADTVNNFFYSTNNNVVRDNVISGVGARATLTGPALTADGILLTGNYQVQNNQILNNTISGGAGNGIALEASTCTGNVMQGNIVSGNAGVGVRVASGNQNPIRQNSIFDNGGLGIDLVGGSETNGVTANDSGDGDSGPNDLQNFPVIKAAALSGNITTVQYGLNSTPNTSFTIDFFRSNSPDATGYGEGQTYLGSQAITTDANGAASNQSFSMAAGNIGSWVTATATDVNGNSSEFSLAVALTPVATTGAIISEFRLHGATGTADEYIEIYNTTSTPLNISGWSVLSAGNVSQTINTGAVIPARGHYLLVGSAYSLGANANGDQTLTADIPDNSGLILRNTSGAVQDAVAFTSSTLTGEGTPINIAPSDNGEYAFVRDESTGVSKDTGDNAADFNFVSTNAGNYNGLQSQLGAPGPSNLLSPAVTPMLTVSGIDTDPNTNINFPPNRSRTPGATGPNATRGTLTFRRKITNNTGATITRLRFRFSRLTTLNSPRYAGGTGTQADLRFLSSNDGSVQSRDNSTTLNYVGTQLETPPAQDLGGGSNSAASGFTTVTLQNGLAPGASQNYQFVFGVETSGGFISIFNIEAVK